MNGTRRCRSKGCHCRSLLLSSLLLSRFFLWLIVQNRH
ncbi:Uncharacterised protein [Vibrio cholerae]|nr:Uncharacterised protein [Vibrio cholerae]CSI72981.1 Uncharacterised protein [Vibrio cholerae]